MFARLLKTCLSCTVDNVGDIDRQSDVKWFRDITHNGVDAIANFIGQNGIIPP